jgi:hypothetical protein
MKQHPRKRQTVAKICTIWRGQGYSAVSRQGEVLRFDRRLLTVTNVMKNAV